MNKTCLINIFKSVTRIKIIYISKLIRKMCRIIIWYMFVCHTPYHNKHLHPLPGRLLVISVTEKGCPDQNILYMKVTQNGSPNTNMIPTTSLHPSNMPSIESSPSGPFVRWFVRYCKRTRMNLFRTRMLFGIDQLNRIHHPHVFRMSTTPPAWSPPSDTLSGNHPEPVVRPRMNSRSEQYTLYRVRTPLTLRCHCVVFVLPLLSCIYCFSPLLIR